LIHEPAFIFPLLSPARGESRKIQKGLGPQPDPIEKNPVQRIRGQVADNLRATVR